MKNTDESPHKKITIKRQTLGKTIVIDLRLIKLLNFIFKKYNDSDLNLEMILEHLGCYKEYIYSICTVFFGMGIIELVETVRLHKSIILMFSGDCKVWGKVGYTSISVFSKAFKRRTGMNILEVKRIISTKSSEQIHNLFIDLLDTVWKGRYEVLKEVSTFEDSEIISEDREFFISHLK